MTARVGILDADFQVSTTLRHERKLQKQDVFIRSGYIGESVLSIGSLGNDLSRLARVQS